MLDRRIDTDGRMTNRSKELRRVQIHDIPFDIPNEKREEIEVILSLQGFLFNSLQLFSLLRISVCLESL